MVHRNIKMESNILKNIAASIYMDVIYVIVFNTDMEYFTLFFKHRYEKEICW